MNNTYRIIYLENSDSDAALMRESLEDEQIPLELTILKDGQAALNFIERKPFVPDLVILDIYVPKVNGLSVLGVLREDPVLRSVPVLLFVGLKGSADLNSNALKADLRLEKPFDWDGYRDVAKSIRSLIERPHEQASSAGA